MRVVAAEGTGPWPAFALLIRKWLILARLTAPTAGGYLGLTGPSLGKGRIRRKGITMEVLSGEQMRNVDRRAIDGMGIASLLLMESAGRGVAEALCRDFPEDLARGILILCGKGNNGGDGLVVARHLARSGFSPRVLLFASASELKGDAAVNLRAALASGVPVEEIPDPARWERLRPEVRLRGAIAVDALLGTGVRGGARGLLAQVIGDLNESGAVVASVDLPSGLDADGPAVHGPAVRASVTYTLCRPKLPLVLEPAARFAGRLAVIPIGIPDRAVAEEKPDLEWLDAEAVRALLPPRPDDAHKGTYGHLLAIAGSRGKSGAGVLLGRAALRSGVGLVTVATPASVQPLVASQQAEIMTEPLAETASGSLSAGSTARVLALASSRTALAIGPGIGTEKETQEFLKDVVLRASAPAVVDADGLNAIADSSSTMFPPLKRRSGPLVLTPHPGEAARLCGATTAEVQSDRLGTARRLARESGAILVLKGHRTVIASPDGRAAINSSGNPGMATAGTGDVLTGIIGAFLARGLVAWDAARLAVFVHGDAGDRAALARGQEGMIAADLLERLPDALAALGRQGEFRRW